MAEPHPGPLSKLFSKLRGNEVNEPMLAYDEIREVQLNHLQSSNTDSPMQIHRCDVCMEDSALKLSLYLCYVCGVYLCDKCYEHHDKTHGFVKRIKIMKRKAEGVVFGMRRENQFARTDNLDGETIEFIGKVNVKHELDKHNCEVSAISGLEKRKWMVLDNRNSCLKIYQSGKNRLLRYIKFGSKPWDVTKIKVGRQITDHGLAFEGKTAVSKAGRSESDKHSLLAVTLPSINQIWFIDVNQTPAMKIKSIKMEKECCRITFSEDKMFVLCKSDVEVGSYSWSIDMLSTEGIHLGVIQIPDSFTLYIPDIAVCRGQVYLSDQYNHKILNINVDDGRTTSQLTIEGSVPTGVSVDHDNNVYVCGQGRNKVYKLSLDLREYEPVSLNSVYTVRPDRLCFHNNKLFISHTGSLAPHNFVTVVLLT